jgi:hypothetical protein
MFLIIGWLGLMALSGWFTFQGCGLLLFIGGFTGKISKLGILFLATAGLLAFFTIRAAPFDVSFHHA